MATLLQHELPRIDPTLRILDLSRQSTLVDNALVRERALALLSGFFSMVAIVLVIAGLYGVLSYGVVARTREIGIRVALGARPLRVMGLVLTEVALMTAIGLAVGIAGGFAGSRFLTSLLYQVQPSDVTSVALPLISILVAAGLSALTLRGVPSRSIR